MQLGGARVGGVIIVNRLDAVELYFTDTARSADSSLESVDVVRGLVLLEVLGVPAFVHASINEPEIVESHSVIRALELQVAIKWALVDESVHKELHLVKDTHMVLLVLDLEVTVR